MSFVTAVRVLVEDSPESGPFEVAQCLEAVLLQYDNKVMLNRRLAAAVAQAVTMGMVHRGTAGLAMEGLGHKGVKRIQVECVRTVEHFRKIAIKKEHLKDDDDLAVLAKDVLPLGESGVDRKNISKAIELAMLLGEGTSVLQSKQLTVIFSKHYWVVSARFCKCPMLNGNQSEFPVGHHTKIPMHGVNGQHDQTCRILLSYVKMVSFHLELIS